MQIARLATASRPHEFLSERGEVTMPAPSSNESSSHECIYLISRTFKRGTRKEHVRRKVAPSLLFKRGNEFPLQGTVQ